MKPFVSVLHEQAVLPEEHPEIPYWKRILDISCVVLAIPMLLPLVLLIAAIIKIVSSGPIFYRQKRVGLSGRPFTCWKFRTMRVGASTTVHKDHFKSLVESELPMTKMDALGDSRLIPMGASLRAMGLDELPQLINVIRGEMSIVGPRPSLPGLTGLWQVSGKNKTTFNEMVRLDILYARNKSVWLDLKIMSRTVSTLISQVRDSRNGRVESTPDKDLQTASR